MTVAGNEGGKWQCFGILRTTSTRNMQRMHRMQLQTKIKNIMRAARTENATQRHLTWLMSTSHWNCCLRLVNGRMQNHKMGSPTSLQIYILYFVNGSKAIVVVVVVV